MSNPELTQEQAVSLLEKLCNDDAFRDTFTTDPAKALESLGVDCEGKTLPTATSLQLLASKDEFSASFEKLSKNLKTVPPFANICEFKSGRGNI